MPRGNQVVRQWRLLQLVSRPGGLTIDAAARELGCAARTVWRDLRALQDAGFPIYDERAYDGRRGVWRVEGGFRQGLPVPLTLDEVVALILSESLLAPAGTSPLIEQARAVRLAEDATRWTAWARYSARQDRRMEWTGLVGAATYEGDLAPFWPYLVFGQWVHVGKGATFGLGAYRLEPLDAGAEATG